MLITVALLLRGDIAEREKMESEPQADLRKWLTHVIDKGVVFPTDSIFENFLGPDDLMRVEEIWERSSEPKQCDEKSTWVKGKEIILTYRHAKCLVPGGGSSWLDDNIVDTFLGILRQTHQDQFVDTFVANSFLHVKACKKNDWRAPRWLNKGGPFTRFLIPLKTTDHWAVMDMNLLEKTIVVYNGCTNTDLGPWNEIIEHVFRCVTQSNVEIRDGEEDSDADISESDESGIALDKTADEKLSLLLKDAKSQRLAFLFPADQEDAGTMMRASVVVDLENAVSHDTHLRSVLAAIYKDEECTADPNCRSENDDMVAGKYVSKMAKAYVWGGEHELVSISRVLQCPVVVHQHSAYGEVKTLWAYNSTDPNLPLHLLRSNITNPKLAHYDLMIPAVHACDLHELSGYGRALEEAFSQVVVHPIKMVSVENKEGKEFWVFGCPGDGNCLFHTAAFWGKLRGIPRIESVVVWERNLPSLNPEEAQSVAYASAQWKRAKNLSDLAVGGQGSYDESSLSGVRRLMKLLHVLSPSIKGVTMDIGHGVAQVPYFLSQEGPAIGIEEDAGLHCLAKACGLQMDFTGPVALRCMHTDDLESYNGVAVALQYESMAGRVAGENESHMVNTEKLLQAPTMQAFTTTKLQLTLLTQYIQNSSVIASAIPKWAIIKVDGVKRKGNAPMTYLYVRKTAIYGGAPDVPDVPDVGPSAVILDMIEAAKHRARGEFWKVVQISEGKSIGALALDELNLRCCFGMMTFTCYMTGLSIVTGATVKVHNGPDGVMMGFAKLHNVGCPELSPGQVILRTSEGSYVLVPQQDLVGVDTGLGVEKLQRNDYMLAKQFLQETRVEKTVRRSQRKKAAASSSASSATSSQPEDDDSSSDVEMIEPKKRTKTQPKVKRNNRTPEAIKADKAHKQREYRKRLKLESTPPPEATQSRPRKKVETLHQDSDDSISTSGTFGSSNNVQSIADVLVGRLTTALADVIKPLVQSKPPPPTATQPAPDRTLLAEIREMLHNKQKEEEKKLKEAKELEAKKEKEKRTLQKQSVMDKQALEMAKLISQLDARHQSSHTNLADMITNKQRTDKENRREKQNMEAERRRLEKKARKEKENEQNAAERQSIREYMSR